MLRLIGYYLENEQNIIIYPLISFVLFFTFFILIVVWIMKVDKEYINRLKELPFDKKKNVN